MPDKKSIFDLTDVFEYQSPWQSDWLNDDLVLKTQQTLLLKSAPGVTIKHCDKLTTLPLKTDFLLSFELQGTYVSWGGTYHNIELTCNKTHVTLTTKKVSVEEGWVFLTKISSSKAGSATVSISVDGTVKKTVAFTFVDSKDLFNQSNYDTLIDELNYIKPFADAYAPAEYNNNYCMSAAERGLSELLSNTTDFYAVNRTTHTRKNKIGFSGKTADDRAATFSSKGFVDSTLSFPTSDFKIVLNKTFVEENGEYKDKDTVVTMRDPTNVKTAFETSINNEAGYHIYYCSIAGANHTMLLVINNTNPCEPTYEMWDQHGLSSSTGLLKNIANGVGNVGGINSQVQWLVRWLRGVKKTQGATKADTFYPQLTCNFYKIKRK